jgi:hypothetical protein
MVMSREQKGGKCLLSFGAESYVFQFGVPASGQECGWPVLIFVATGIDMRNVFCYKFSEHAHRTQQVVGFDCIIRGVGC